MSNQFFEKELRNFMEEFQQVREMELDPVRGSIKKQKPKSNEDWYHFYSV